MFTGLIEAVGKVTGIERHGAARLTVEAPFPTAEIHMGDSIAVNGVCLTVVGKGGGTFTFDVSPETIDRTAFRRLRSGSRVNLERALRLSDRLGGHLVTGHADFVAVVAERREASGNIMFSFRIPGEFSRYLVEKGSVAIDGISLTVNSVTADGFTVNVIPHTAERTILKEKRAGDEVNIETDIIGKYLERLLSAKAESKGVTLDLLAKNGFL
ncbi:MAG TPA: riboflavin synthase [Geobacteraceae bacterium]|nr:riboflavin synthase [Geobacteraceae bacterium]